jgi:hypothetical protein
MSNYFLTFAEAHEITVLGTQKEKPMSIAFPPTPKGCCPVCRERLDVNTQPYMHHGYSRIHAACRDDIEKLFRQEQWREGNNLIYKYVRREA